MKLFSSQMCTLLFILGLSSSGFGQTQGLPKTVEKSAFLETLNGIDTVPTKAGFVARFPKAALLLEQAGCDPKTKTYARHRAISFLSMFEDEGREALTRLTKCALPEVQERAIYTLARAFSEDKKVIQLVLNFNHLNSKTTALWSIRALRWISPKIAKPKLTELLKSDKIAARKLAQRILKRHQNSNPDY